MTEPKSYFKKPCVISAMQWTGRNTKDVLEFCPKAIDDKVYLLIPTLEGVMKARMSDFIIKGIQGEFYPCKEDVFHATYEEVGTINRS